MSGGGGGGNRQDNRQRGNAAQLLEKYKSMARDAQLGGDRVQTEYYLQFADHYFRVLGESRSRFDEPRGRGRDEDGDGDGDEDEGAEMAESDAEAEAAERPQPRRGSNRQERYERGDRPERGNGRGRDDRDDRHEDEGGERIAFDVLPPAIGAEAEPAAEVGSDEDAPKPRRRARRPRADDSDTEIAPAA
jgi:hypothetical protein